MEQNKAGERTNLNCSWNGQSWKNFFSREEKKKRSKKIVSRATLFWSTQTKRPSKSPSGCAWTWCSHHKACWKTYNCEMWCLYWKFPSTTSKRGNRPLNLVRLPVPMTSPFPCSTWEFSTNTWLAPCLMQIESSPFFTQQSDTCTKDAPISIPSVFGARK